MKFIFADSLDTVDPAYDFLADRLAANRVSNWDDAYPHELMDSPPYDGVLVSRGIVGDHRIPGKYTPAQAMRFRRVGARRFLRLDAPKFDQMPIYGDCGAFTYVQEEVPPYSPQDVVDFYADGGFTHGCSVDHIILDFDREDTGPRPGSPDARARLEITLQNATEFFRLSKGLGKGFQPLGVAQGWSPSSLAECAARLERMGYSYIAVGGLVPLRVEDIHRCLAAIRERVSTRTQLHLLGFAKAESISQFTQYRVSSFDSTSPLIRAFKDAKANYYLRNSAGLEYYAAVRIPQALENARLLRAVKAGLLRQEDLVRMEHAALSAVRSYDAGEGGLEDAVESVADYGSLLAPDPTPGSVSRTKMAAGLRIQLARTLRAMPWKQCTCSVCRELSVEVIIFRSSNRNKRRGFHNLGVFYDHVRSLLDKDLDRENVLLPRLAG